MKISILTLFPEMFTGPFQFSIIKNAIEKKLVEIDIINIRDFGIGKHKIVDDTPYGGGIGMVMRPDVLLNAINYTKKAFFENYEIGNSLKNENWKLNIKQKIVLLSASGKKYTQNIAKEFSKIDHLILICGHYEGVDERILNYIDIELSIGDFVITGGEIPSMLIADSVIRLLPGVLKSGAAENESFSLTGIDGKLLLEYPQYTKPQQFESLIVPEVLLSGNHKKISQWRMDKALKKTEQNRPDLLKK